MAFFGTLRLLGIGEFIATILLLLVQNADVYSVDICQKAVTIIIYRASVNVI